MTQKELNKIIDKYLEGKASLNDLEILKKFELFTENRLGTNIFKNVSKKEALKKEMFLYIQKRNNSKKTNYYQYAVAASVVLLISLTIFLDKKNNVQPKEPVIVNTIIQPGTDKATLTLEDGSQIALEKGESIQTSNANSNGEKIVYEAVNRNTKEVAYNYLTIQRGGQFNVVLSDGTVVWLNSESQLKYPVNFIEGEIREVELVYGEAYFDVSPSRDHGGSKFKVINKAQDVEVIGTQFNIKAYKDDKNIYTTLVEGKVIIDNGVSVQNLKPSQQSNLDINTNTFEISEVDVYENISWKDGVFTFRNKSLKDIMKVLSRWYNVDIIFENKKLESLKFNGTLNKHQNIEEILLIMESTRINNYEIKDKTITLK